MTDAPAAPVNHAIHATGRERMLAHVAMILFASMIAASFTLGKLALPYVDPVPYNAVRFVLGAVFMGVVAYGWQRHRLAMPPAPWRHAVNGALMAIYFVFMFVALTMTSPVATSAVFTLMPILTAIMAFLILRQVVRPVVALSLFFAGLGSVWVIFRGDINALMAFDIGTGELIFFLGCICHAVFAVFVRRFNRGEPLTVATFFLLVGISFWILLFGMPQILATDWLHLPPVVWWTLAYMAIFPTGVTFFLMQYATLRLPSAKVLAYGYLVPCYVIIYEGLAGHGWTSLPVVIGALVTVLGLLVLYLTPDN